MANRFYVAPPDALSALMAGVQGYEGARKRMHENALGEIAPDIAAGNYQAAMAKAAQAGPGGLQALMGISRLSSDASDRAFRERSFAAQRADSDRSHGLQRDQLIFQQDEARRRSALEPWQPGEGGALTPRPGGPADPNYLRNAQDAKKPGGSFEDEQKLRKEFESNAKTHLDVRRGFQRVLASKDDAAGDISLIFGYMKMLDPGSVVREGEFATAQNSAGIPDQVRNMYNRALSGERLNPNQRDMFKGQAKSLYDKSAGEYSAREQQFRDIATRYGVDPSRVIPSLGPEPALPMRPAPAQPALNLPNIPPPPPGAVIVGR